MADVLKGFAASVARSGQLVPEGFLRLAGLGSKKMLMLSARVSGNCVQACQAGMMPLAEAMPRKLCMADNDPIVVRRQLAYQRSVQG